MRCRRLGEPGVLGEQADEAIDVALGEGLDEPSGEGATTLAISGPGAECLTVRNGRIIHSRFIFDCLPFEAAQG